MERADRLMASKAFWLAEDHRLRPSTRLETIMESKASTVHHEPWNKGKIVGRKAPFKLKDIWALRTCLQMEVRVRELAQFYLGIHSKLRGFDLVAPKARDIWHGDQLVARAIVMQHNPQRPAQFEITRATRKAVRARIKLAELRSDEFLFPSRIHESSHLGTRQYARILAVGCTTWAAC